MKLDDAGIPGLLLVSIGAIDALRREFVTVLLPMAKRLKVLPMSKTPQQLLDDLRAGLGNSNLTHPRDRAALKTALVAAGIVLSERMSREDFDSSWETVASDAGKLMSHTYGYLTAIEDFATENARRGANGRRQLGAATAQRVRDAAAPFRGKKSREAVANLLASEIGKSPQHIRKLLTQEFPGAMWDDGEPAIDI